MNAAPLLHTLAFAGIFGDARSVSTGVPVDAPHMDITLPWQDGGSIPPEHTCDGAERSPAIGLPALPEGTTHLAVIMDDPDASRGTWVHWLWWDAPAGEIQADAEPGISGKNSWGRIGYGGPCPPAGDHRYYVHAYALKGPLGLAAGSDRDAFAAAVSGKVLAQGSVMGRYAR